jgi:hypothetical protein
MWKFINADLVRAICWRAGAAGKKYSRLIQGFSAYHPARSARWAIEARFQFRSPQASYCVNEGVLGDPAEIQPHSLRGLQDLLVDVEAGVDFPCRKTTKVDLIRVT